MILICRIMMPSLQKTFPFRHLSSHLSKPISEMLGADLANSSLPWIFFIIGRALVTLTPLVTMMKTEDCDSFKLGLESRIRTEAASPA